MVRENKNSNLLRRDVNQDEINTVLLKALELDAMFDITSDALGLATNVSGRIFNSKACYVSGIEEVKYLFEKNNVKVNAFHKDGAFIKKDTPIVEVFGDSRTIFRIIRTALDVMMLMSGITTLTRKFHKKIGKKITAVRKVYPCLGSLEKKAVSIGKGNTHRLSLADGYLLKPFYVEAYSQMKKITYLEALKDSIELCRKHRESNKKYFFIEAEVRTEEEAEIAAQAGADIVMLDNFDHKTAIKLAKKLKTKYRGLLIEVSGGITIKNCEKYNNKCIDFISTSRITFYAKPIDMYFRLD
ncbi:MAG: hypothetical protein N3E37_02625 [Candidatus Micrarchaeota archaeon]|nr:hypothetical protein [Candidatus Micrarchaeota archaeon]